MLHELATNSYCLKGALWTLYGHSNMASLCSQQLLRLDSKQVSVCIAMCNVARALAEQVLVFSKVLILICTKLIYTVTNYFL